MKRMLRKLSQTSGETITETLAALLVCVLAVIILTSAMTASAAIDQSAKTRDETIQAELNDAAGNGTVAGDVTFTQSGSAAGQTYNVRYTSGTDDNRADEIVSYSGV